MMLRIKRLYTYVLQTFMPLFFMTFGICWFIVLMQFVWRYIDEMVGKGLPMEILAELLWYAALNLIYMALPLAILLASLMTFGNLGERFELLAMKSAGVSLIRIMRPLIVTLTFISVGAFLFQNYIVPVVQVKFYSLLYSVNQKSPELDIPEGAFYKGVTGFNIYVKKKEKSGTLKDIMIYDYSDGFNNTNLMVADSGHLSTSADKLFLVLALYNGESFQNLKAQQASTRNREAVSYQRESFRYREILIEFDANFERTDESLLQNQYIGKNLKDLQSSIDTMGYRLDSVKNINSKNIYDYSYRKSLKSTSDSLKNKEITAAIPPEKSETVINYDSAFNRQEPSVQLSILNQAKSMTENVKSEYMFRTITLKDEAVKYRRHLTEWHKKFTLSFACFMFFFIGAPLGAIIRKGGLGMPVVISVLLFIVYYIIDNIGFKMARDGVWPAWQGMWLSSFVLTPLGLFLTYKSVNDSAILNADTYLNTLKNFFGKRINRKVDKKDVIIFNPDYAAMSAALQKISDECALYLSSNRRWVNYISFWKQGGRDPAIKDISEQMEAVVEELSNSDSILLLNKLMDYPVMDSDIELNIKLDKKTGLIIGAILPAGILVYLIAVYRRKMLLHDVGVIRKTSNELSEIITSI